MITARSIRGFTIGVTLLLAAAANLMYFSCDADHDKTTPPVIVEFHFVVRAQSGAGFHASLVPVRLAPAQNQTQAVSFSPLPSDGRPLRIGQLSAQVVFPLLC